MISVSGIKTAISKTPSADAVDISPRSQNSHRETAKTSLFLLDNINGMENPRNTWTATQTQPAANAGKRSGKVIASKVRVGVAPQTYAACSNYFCT